MSISKPKEDYLKYWRVVRQFIKKKYNISQSEMDILLFLYSEKYFTKDSFDEFNQLISWDKSRWFRLVRDGWVINMTPNKGTPTRQKATYTVSTKTKAMIRYLYKLLDGEQFSMHRTKNPMFKGTASYTDKVYRNYIRKINLDLKQQQRHSREQ